MYATARAGRAGYTDRGASVIHTPHDPFTLGDATFGGGRMGPTGGEQPDEKAEESNTFLYVGLSLGVLAVGGLVYYLATQKKGRRRSR